MKTSKKLKSKEVATNFKRNHVIVLAVILIVTLFVYSSVGSFNFVNWDDDRYVLANEVIKELSVENIKTIFTSFYVSNYQPLTMLTYALDYQIGGLNPKVFHITNLIIHLLNAGALYLLTFILFSFLSSNNVLIKITRPKIILLSGIVALLFSIHPLQVETVAWIAERKNLLFTLFFFISLIYYVHYLQLGKVKYIVFSLVFFLFSSMSKGVAVSLSLTLVCIDYLAGRNLISKKVILEKAPFFILSFVFGIIAIYAQNESGALEREGYSFFHAISYAAYAFIGYPFKTIWPLNLSACYLYPNSITWVYWLTLVLSAGIIILIVKLILKGKRLLVFGILFYVANIVFLLQLIPVGSMIMADRYAYVAAAGIFLIIGISYLYFSEKKPVLSNSVLILFLLFIAIVSSNRLKVWQNSLTLWNDVISKSPEFENAWNNRGRINEDNENYKAAVEDYEHFVNTFKASPNLQRAYSNLGNAKLKLDDFDGALKAFDNALLIDSSYFEAYVNKGILHRKKKEYDMALINFNKALELSEHFAIYYNKGITEYDMGSYTAAINDLEKVRNEKPELTDITLANSYFQTGQYNKAIEIYLELIKKDPSLPVYRYMAYAYYKVNNYENAIWAYDRAVSQEPDNVTIYADRGITKMNSGDYSGAIKDFNQVLGKNKNDAASFYNRGMSYINMGNAARGCSDLHSAKSLGYLPATKKINVYCK